MTTTADLAVREETVPALHVPVLPVLPDVDSWIRAMASIAKLAAQICNTPFVPDGLRGNDAAVTAAILTGRELGMGPMQSLRNIHVIKGVPSLNAEYKRAKVLSAGHEFRILAWDDSRCQVAARRRGDHGDPLTVEYTMAMARRAGLDKRNPNYQANPMAMLMARVTTLVTNAIFADVTNGLATTELLDDADVLADAVGTSVELPALSAPPVADLKARAALQTGAPQDPSPAPGPAPAGAVPPSAESAGEAPRKPQPASSGQVGMIRKRFAELYPGEETPADRLQRLEDTAKLAGVAGLSTTSDLTAAQARRVRDVLDSCKSAAELEALLKDGEVPGE